MVEATKSASEIEKDAESAKRPSGTKIELNITKPKSLSEQPKPTISPSNEVFSNIPDAGLDPVDRGEPPLRVEDDLGVSGSPEIVWEDDIGVYDFIGEADTHADIMVDDTPVRIKKVEPETDYAKAFKDGFSSTALGMAINGPPPKSKEQSFGEDVVTSLGAIAGDLPTFLVGYFGMGGPANPVLSMGGGFAMVEGVKKAMTDAVENGEVNSAGDWWQRYGDMLEEGGKGFIVGAATGGAGKTAATAAEMAEASAFVKKLAVGGSEVATMTSVGAGLEGRVPTPREFAVAAVALGAMKGAAKSAGELVSTVKKLKEIYAETGTHPSKVTLERLMAPISNERGGVEFGRGDFEALKKDIESRGIELDLFEDDARITLSKIVIPKKSRGQGIGSDVLAKIKEYADSTGKDIVLTPSKTFGATSVKRLEAFYKRQGFKENKGRNTDFGTRERFIYKPNPLLNERGGGEFGKGDEDPSLFEHLKRNKKNPDPKIQNALKIYKVFLAAEKEKEKLQKFNAKKFLKKAKELIVERKAPIKDKVEELYSREFKKEAESFERALVLREGYKARVNVILEPMLFEINKGLSKQERFELGILIASKRAIEISGNRRRKQLQLLKAKNILEEKLAPLKKKLEAIEDKQKKDRMERGKAYQKDISAASSVKKGIAPIQKLLKKAEEELVKYDPRFTHQEGTKPNEYEDTLDTIPPKRKAKLEGRAEIFHAAMRSQLDALLEEGLLTQEAYNAIAHEGKFYSPRQLIEAYDPEERISLHDSTKKIMGSGLKKLDKGHPEFLNNNHTEMLEEVVIRTQRRIMNNRSAKAAYRLAEIGSEAFALPKEGEGVPEGWLELSAVIEGETKNFYIREDLGRVFLDEKHDGIERNLRYTSWALGVPLLKATATGYNPVFAVTALLRDSFYFWGNRNLYSPHMPIGFAELTKDIAVVSKDAWKKEGRYIDAAMSGGLGHLFTSEGQISGLKGKTKMAADFMGKLPEFAEAVIRLAARERALKQGKSPEEAAFIARDMIDFAQGGSLTKFLDHGVPYLNPAVLATTQMLKYAKNNKLIFTYKMVQLAGLAGGIYMYNMESSPEAYQNISPAIKARFFIIMLPMFKQKDKNGNERVPYLTMPKDQGQQMFATFFDAAAAWIRGDTFNAKQFAEAFLNGIPASDASFFPPTASFILGMKNYSLFFRDKIVKGPEKELWEQYTSNTHPLSYGLGQLTSVETEDRGRKSLPIIGISPQGLDASIGSLIAHSNPIRPIFSEATRFVLDQVPGAQKRDMFDKWGSALFANRILRWSSTSSRNDIDLVDEVLKEQNTARSANKRKVLDALSQEGKNLGEREAAADKVIEKIRVTMVRKGERDAADFEEKALKKYMGNIIDMEKLKSKFGSVPNKGFWFKLKTVRDPIEKAAAYHRVWETKKEETRKLYDQLLGGLNIVSKDQERGTAFYAELNRLRKGSKK